MLREREGRSRARNRLASSSRSLSTLGASRIGGEVGRRRSMGFVSFFGRVLFASVFLLSAYQEIIEFGVDGGPAVKLVAPKYNTFVNHVTSHLAVNVPEIEMKHLVGALIVLRGLGSLLFIFSSSFGAYLLILYLLVVTPLLFDFYNYDMQMPEFVELFVKFAQNLALVGALLFFLGMKNLIPKRQPKRKTPKSKTA